MTANARLTLGCRCSGASEEDQRLRFCALRPARRCHPRHEGAQWKGLLPYHSNDPASSQQNHHFLLHPGGGWFPHWGDPGQAGGQGQLCAIYQRNRRTRRISADWLCHLLSRTDTAFFSPASDHKHTSSENSGSSSRCTTHRQRISAHPCFTHHRHMQPCRVSFAFRWQKHTSEVEVWWGRHLSEVRKCDKSASVNLSDVTVNSRLSMMSSFNNHRITLWAIFYPGRFKKTNVSLSKIHARKSKYYKNVKLNFPIFFLYWL